MKNAVQHFRVNSRERWSNFWMIDFFSPLSLCLLFCGSVCYVFICVELVFNSRYAFNQRKTEKLKLFCNYFVDKKSVLSNEVRRLKILRLWIQRIQDEVAAVLFWRYSSVLRYWLIVGRDGRELHKGHIFRRMAAIHTFLPTTSNKRHSLHSAAAGYPRNKRHYHYIHCRCGRPPP